jgi:hypothetical protein
VTLDDTNTGCRAAMRQALEPYFRDLDDSATRIVPISRTRRLRDDGPEKVRRAAELMDAAAAGRIAKREPLRARANADGTYTILDGKSTHANLEQLGVAAVPLVVVERL